MPKSQIFDPEGLTYDYESARKYGLGPGETGHWPSRVPQTGLLLKGRSHETWPLTIKGETEAGYKVIFRNGRYYSVPVDKMTEEISQMNKAMLNEPRD